MIHDLARKIAFWLGKELGQEERAAVMAYGLELLLGAVVKLVCFTTVPLLLGIFPQVAAALLASVVFRLAAGGAHCTAYYRCLIWSLVTFTSLGSLARPLLETGIPARDMTLAAALFAVIVALIRAPADTPAKPITREVHRRALKVISLLVPLCYVAVVWFFPLRKDLVAASALGLAFQSFTVTPAGYRFVEWLDVFLGRLHSTLIPGKGGVKNAA